MLFPSTSLALVICLLALFSSVRSEEMKAPVQRILCIGDSITQADPETYSWRYFLWKDSLNRNAAVDFVGPFTENEGGNPDWPKHQGKAFDQDHAARWGWTANKVADHLPGWLEKLDADVALIHLGTNDLLLGQGARSTLKDLDEIIRILRKDNPRIRILIAQIIPSASSRDFRPFIEGLEQQAPKWSTAASPVELVDCFNGFDVDEWTYDGLHPLWKGEEFIAQRFASVLWPKEEKDPKPLEPMPKELPQKDPEKRDLQKQELEKTNPEP